MKISKGDFTLETETGKELIFLTLVSLLATAGIAKGIKLLEIVAKREDLPTVIEKSRNIIKLADYKQKNYQKKIINFKVIAFKTTKD
ncbi:hypothetical protein [Priestia aryabhattai]|uniref:hypothetical protein n=1 Tax=Priestia aryabhattai TaxID=412384 RepID=UPI001ADCE085|nr:hypothetical protein [Priestia aryabhattai]QTL52441.1 hypothetical protein J5Z55_28810 [Priestia aryabhattai]